MSYYDEASLVMIPSGYKTSKVYSIKPTDGSGDLAFTRSNDTATRVGPDGLIEKVRTNLILQSQTFDNASWIKDFGASITANTTAAPDGTTTADTLTIADTQYLFQNIVLVAGNPYTISIYVKVASGTNQFKFNTFGSSNNFTSSAFTATTTWQRFSYTFTAVGSGSTAIYPLIVDGLAGGSFFIWGAQVETTDFGATSYIATTSAAVSVGPVANVPRLDYLNSSCPRLLLEPQRTNLIQYSEQLNNAWWTAAGSTITANTAVAPDGTTSMDRLTETTATSSHQVISSSVTIFGGGARAFSAFVKKGNVRYIQLANVAFGDSSASAIFDLDTKTVTASRASSGAGPAFSFVSASVEDYGNGILRLILVNTCSFDAPTYHIAHSNQATFSGATLVDGVISYAGNASSYTDIWGCGLESGAYATSYIPTLGAAVTRGADAAVKASVTSLIGQTEGTIFMDAVIDAFPTDNSFFGVEKTASSFVIRFGSGGSSIYAQVYNGSTNLFFEPTPYTLGTRVKLAFAYKAGSYAFYKNGTLVATGTNATAIPACDSIMTNSLWGNTGNGKHGISQALLFKTRLSNSELAALTA